MLSPEECQRLAEFMQGFSNPLRVRILCKLRNGERTVGEIATELGEKQSNVSQQLAILYHKGYVTRKKHDRHVYYWLRDESLCEIMEQIVRYVLKDNTRTLKSV
ncbi:MAG: metalloregulator ArsR/SmtB family transcription factor [Bacillota bacterium]